MPKIQLPLLLDSFPNATAAFSLRKLRTAYNGNCIRVRRSSDNTEQDIGFSGGLLDVTTLLSFVGAENGFITTWYDQSGNGNNATQTTAGNQPRIVNGGVVELEPTTNKIGVRGLYANQTWMTAGNVLNIGNSSMVSFVLGNLTTPNNLTGFYGKTVFGSAQGRYAIVKDNNNTISLVQRLGGNTITSQTGIGTDTQKLYNQSVILGDGNRLYVNNVNTATNTNNNNNVVGTNPFRFIIGAYANSTDTGIQTNSFYDRWFQELIIYIDSASNLPSISNVNNNINSYYNVY
jgi:hypothetical protein